MKKKICSLKIAYICSALLVLGQLSGCSPEVSNIGHAQGQTETQSSQDRSDIGRFDSADTAVVASADLSKKTVTLHNIKADRNYTLKYDETTYLTDRYGGALVMEQVTPGTVADVRFMKDTKKLVSLHISPDAWDYDDVRQFDLGRGNSTASIGSAVYHLSPETPVFSNGENGQFMDIVQGDVISVSGIGNEIYGISVEKGHGYLKLINDDALIGGWIEVGNAVITTISENMMLVVPEGSYTVHLYNGDTKGDRDITVGRNQETDIDCSDIQSEKPKTGYVTFSLDPSDAKLQIDGSDTDTSAPVELTYGIHQISVSADGYETISKYISVGTDMANITLKLDSEETASSQGTDETASSKGTAESSAETVSDESAAVSSASSASTVSGNSTSAKASETTSNVVYVDAPADCSVYLDGTYIGTSPACFTKTTGSHTITFTKKGYVSRSYTVYLYNDGSDITYSFADLKSDGTVSGND